MKRSPMPPRRQPLKSSPPPARRIPLQARSARRSASRPVEEAARDEVLLRDRGCVARIVPCGPRLDPHHIWRQSQGGPWTDWNLITLCDACHRWVHDHPLLAQCRGWLVPSWAGRDGCAAAAALRSSTTLTFAPWLTVSEKRSVIDQDQRFSGAPTLYWPRLTP